MFGISGAEFLVIVLVGVLVIPVRYWPDVARFLARAVRYVRGMIWRVTDAGEEIRRQVDLERPIDDLIKTTTDDLLAEFSSVRGKKRTDRGGGRKRR